MQKAIGELILQVGHPLLKMWSIDVDSKIRPYVKHSHTRFEITVVNHGSGEYTTESAVYPMLPGDVFVFSSNEIHCITKIGKEGLSITNLHFEPRYLSKEFAESYGDNYLNFCFYHSDEFQNRIPAKEAELLRYHHTMIKEEFLKEGEQYPLAIQAHMHLMLIDLLRNHQYRNSSAFQNAVFDILSVYDYIEDHLCENLTLADLAQVAGVSPNYFSHVFKKLNGITLWDYITAKRVEKASKLLRSKDHSLTMLEIALECGFNNTVNFNKAFKKQKGLTPSELRRNPKLLSH